MKFNICRRIYKNTGDCERNIIKNQVKFYEVMEMSVLNESAK